LIYIKKDDAKSKFDDWCEHIQKQQAGLSLTLDNENALRFDTTHKATASGLDYFVKHIAVCLYHVSNPT